MLSEYEEHSHYIDYISIFELLNDYDNLVKLCRMRMEQTIELHMDDYKYEKIDEIIVKYGHEQVMCDLKPLMPEFISILSNKHITTINGIDYLEHYNTIDESIYQCILDTLSNIYNEKVFIKREYSFDYSPVKNKNLFKNKNIDVLEKQLNYLQNLPQPQQRTPEWYDFRHNCITASSAWKILDTEKQRENYIKSKVIDINSQPSYGTNIESPFHHGHKYEPLSIMIYEETNNTRVGEFGCIKHNKYNFIGASPDGININKDSEKYGTLLEIKNVVSRDITGVPKKEYWIQMQMQMEVCDLDYCDFLETKFTEYDNEQEFLDDADADVDDVSSIYKNKNGDYIGLIIMFYINEEPLYEYCPITKSISQLLEWKDSTINKYLNTVENCSWVNNIYWRCDKYSCVCVERNQQWFNSVFKKFESIWETIKTQRCHQSRLCLSQDSNSLINANKTSDAKNKKRTAKSSELFNSGKIGVCLIKLD